MQTQRMYYSDHQHRPASVATSENLADRVLRVGKTIVDLRRRLATEKEMLQKEKIMTASMYLLPTTNEYYTLVTPRGNVDASQHREEKFYPQHSSYHDSESLHRYAVPAENGLDNMSLTSSEKNFIQHERKMAALSRVHAYRTHLKDVENKCNVELGAVRDSIYNLKRVSTELDLEMNEHRHPHDRDKDFFYED